MALDKSITESWPTYGSSMPTVNAFLYLRALNFYCFHLNLSQNLRAHENFGAQVNLKTRLTA